jgi:hypothetical protein
MNQLQAMVQGCTPQNALAQPCAASVARDTGGEGSG